MPSESNHLVVAPCFFCGGYGRFIKPPEDRAVRPVNQINMPAHWPSHTEIMVCAVCKFTGRVKTTLHEPKYERRPAMSVNEFEVKVQELLELIPTIQGRTKACGIIQAILAGFKEILGAVRPNDLP